ncbi:MAG: protein translocase subunit SecDF [Chitinophagales bacterium]|nr:protein translocase subunit SecDF [Chitinophagales bacterium]
MRGKGLVTFFSIALILICIYQLSFNFVTNRVETKATEIAEAKVLVGKPNKDLPDSTVYAIRKIRQNYLDSMSNQKIYNIGITNFTYQDCKDQQLNLGLDLQGGMNVVMQVAIDDLVKALADNNNDPNFLKALDLAKQKQKTQPQADFVSLFQQSWNEVAPNGKLASIFATRNNQELVKLTSSNDEVVKFIRTESTGAFDRTFNILRSRIDKFGVTQPNITAEATSGRITVELPGVDNPARVRKLLQASAVLEFWETYDNTQFYQYLEAANTSLKNRLSLTDTSKKSTESIALESNNENENLLLEDSASKADNAISANDSGKLEADSSASNLQSQEQARKDNPLYAVMRPQIYQDKESEKYNLAQGPVIGSSLGTDTAQVNEYLAMDYVKSNFPRDVKFLWGSKAVEEGSNVYQLYAIQKQNGTDRAPLEGDKVVNSKQDVDQNGKAEVTMNMSSEGANIWKKLTAKQVAKYGKDAQGNDLNGFIAIVLDNYVYSAPRVSNEIPNGRSSITGGFSIDEAKDLATILQAGKLPAPAGIIAEDVVGPSLGKESVHKGIQSIIIAFIAILAFMVLYYNTSGIIADIALFFNLFFIIGVLASLGATLTLSGIAGIVLTMGMAVDANVIIHERIKEELAKGKTLLKAVQDGHTASYSAIFDSNLTTLLTGLVLAYYGLGPVLGYATTLNIGIILTIFTAVFMAHWMFEWYLKRGKEIKFHTRLSKNNFSGLNIQFVGKRKYAYWFSGSLAVICIASIIIRGFDFGVDFTGGRSYVIKFKESVSTTEVRNNLSSAFGMSPTVKTYGTDDQVKITTGYLTDQNNTTGDSLVMRKMYEGLKSMVGASTFEEFTSRSVLSSQVVGPSISADIKSGAIKAIIVSIIGIFLYILVRFRRWQYSAGVIVALLHDTLMIIGIFALFHGILPFSLEVDETFIAAVLTVMGYSVNDTVIIFDRIREFLRDHPNMDEKTVINNALNVTLNRTVMTSFTVMLVLIILFIFGGEVIRGFAFALMIGVGFGTYSSIFVATPLVVDLSSFGKKLGTGTPVKKPVAVK